MLGLTELGALHTLLSVVALATGLVAMAVDRQILTTNKRGQIYLASTFLVAFSGLFIYTRGVFGPGHVASVLTLIALPVGIVLAYKPLLGGVSRYISVAALTLTFLFHLIAGTTETLIRVPPSAPMVTSLESPLLQNALRGCGVLFLVTVALQWWMLKRRSTRSHE